jgi:phosphopantetheinyl transferase (holo-ACP synthase)
MTTKFDNQTNETLADALGHLDVEVKRLEAAMKEIKAEFAARGVEKIEASSFNVTKSETVRWTLDQAAAKEALGEAWVTQHSKITPVTSWRITVNKAALVAA